MNNLPAQHTCPLCGAGAETAYTGLRDRLFGAPGEWDFVKCGGAECGILWLDPAPSDEELPAAYADYHTHYDSDVTPDASRMKRGYHYLRSGYLSFRYGYGRGSVSFLNRIAGLTLYFLPHFRNAADYRACFLPSVKNGRVLDVGCGNGEKLKILGDLGWMTEGIDTDECAAANARGKGLTVRTGTLVEQNYPEDSFDAVIMIDVIEHARNPRELLGECHRIVKPGGTLIVTTPNAASISRKLYGSDWRGLEPPRHLVIHTPSALRKISRDAGFGKIRIATMASLHMLSASYLLRKEKKPDSPETRLPAYMRYIFMGLVSLQSIILPFKKDAGDVIFLKAFK